MTSEKVNCIACGTPMVRRWQEMYDDRYGYPGFFDIVECPSCRQCQTTPLLEDADLPGLYGNFYPRREIDMAALVRQVGKPGSHSEKRRRWWAGTDNQGQYSATPGMTVLDYGCGAGASLLELEALGAQAYGIEADPNVQQVIDSLRLRIHIGSIDDNPFPGVQFDLIVLNQVIEHIPRPEELLGKFRQRLKPGGRMFLSFPNARSIYARAFKRNWINWHIPYHLHHFNPESARMFLARCGWAVQSIRSITPNLWTVLQCRAAVETTSMGQANPMWTGQALTRDIEARRPRPSWLLRRARAFALAVSRPLPNAVLMAINRTVDRLGWGDSLLVELVPDSRR